MFGAPTANADATVISIADTVLRKIGISNTLNINSIGCPECRPKYRQALVEYFSAHEEELCPTCRERLKTNPLRILDCKSHICSAIAAQCPKTVDYLCEDCQTHFDSLKSVLSEMGIVAGYVLRRGNHILYFKDSSTIEEVLTMAGAPNAAMEIMVKKVERDFNNKINRQVNCEAANLDKTIAAAAIQTDAINKLEKADKLSSLPAALQETARLRVEFPELSLTDLCQKHSSPISRPGLNNRLRKLVKLAEEL